MSTLESVVLVSGITSGERLAALRRFAPRLSGLLLAAPPGVGPADMVDLTAINDEDQLCAAVRGLAGGQRVIVRDHQLGFDRQVDALDRAEARCYVLYPHIAHDMDPGWVHEQLRDLGGRVRVEAFLLDLYCDVWDSWASLSRHGSAEGFGLADLKEVCASHPCLLTADLDVQNLPGIARFPGARGVLIACADLSPRLPLERHTVPFSEIPKLLSL